MSIRTHVSLMTRSYPQWPQMYLLLRWDSKTALFHNNGRLKETMELQSWADHKVCDVPFMSPKREAYIWVQRPGLYTCLDKSDVLKTMEIQMASFACSALDVNVKKFVVQLQMMPTFFGIYKIWPTLKLFSTLQQGLPSKALMFFLEGVLRKHTTLERVNIVQ